eukprot:TRINITY_DN115090_c0_g1_i1.p1 TRINITY_DN115090_c0_g1~~TRINITY_DN115090_c0_g1_i1.p1  ORF type:complete len:513 (-),score=59.25 TRINITY_DN115090_c0_g1_i1:51-1502(-)
MQKCILTYLSTAPFKKTSSCSRAQQLQDCYSAAGCMSRFTLCQQDQYASCGLCKTGLKTYTKTASFLNVSRVVVLADRVKRVDAPLFTNPPANANTFQFSVNTAQPENAISVLTSSGTDGFKTVTVSAPSWSYVEVMYPQSAQILGDESSSGRTTLYFQPSAAVPTPIASRGAVLLDGIAATETAVYAPNLMEGGIVWTYPLGKDPANVFLVEHWKASDGLGCSALVYNQPKKQIWGICAKDTFTGPRSMYTFDPATNKATELWKWADIATANNNPSFNTLINDFTFDKKGIVYFSVTQGTASKLMGGVYKIDPATKKVTQLVKDFREDEKLGGQRLNGLVLSLDDSKLYVVENNKTFKAQQPVRCISEWTLASDGNSVVSKRVILDWNTGYGGDGIAIDTQGIVYSSAGKNYALIGSDETLDNPPGIYAVDPKNPGKLAAYYPGPFQYGTGVCFGGPNMQDLIIASGAYLMTVKTPQPGTFR